jgi:hypothetical protein
LVPSHVATELLGTGHGLQLTPHVITELLDTQLPLQL